MFTDFDIEDAPGCIADYLDIGQGERLCGVLPFETKSEFSSSCFACVFKLLSLDRDDDNDDMS